MLIYSLERLKYEIKISPGNLDKIISSIAGFEFIDSLIEEKLEMNDGRKDIGEFLPRSSKDYVEMVDRRMGIRYEDNEYLNFIKQEISYIKEVEFWREVVYEKIPKMHEVSKVYLIFQQNLKKEGKSGDALRKFKIEAQKKYFRALRELDGRKSDKVTSFSANQIKRKF